MEGSPEVCGRYSDYKVIRENRGRALSTKLIEGM